MLRVSRSKIYALAAEGSLPGVVRIGGSLRISERRLREWIDAEASRAGTHLARPPR
jgi:excisionase family DNA binding protein